MEKRLVALAGFVGALSLSMVVYWHLQGPPIFSTIESPDKKYVVHLRGKRTRPAFPWMMHWVYCDLYRNGQQVIRLRQVHSGDAFDPGFDDLYTAHFWVSNSTLIFHGGNVGERGFDTVNITNNASKPIKFLQVGAVEMFLSFDLPPQARMKVFASTQTWFNWVEVEGEFADGKSIPWKGVNFDNPNLKGPFTYDILINDDGPTISSPELPVYRLE